MTIVDGIKVKHALTIGPQPLLATTTSNIYDQEDKDTFVFSIINTRLDNSIVYHVQTYDFGFINHKFASRRNDDEVSCIINRVFQDIIYEQKAQKLH